MVQPNGTSWHKLEYVEHVVQGDAGLQIYVKQVEQGEGGLQIVVEQVEQDKGSVHLNLSTCSKVGLQGRKEVQLAQGNFEITRFLGGAREEHIFD